jgi:hypothetical protein
LRSDALDGNSLLMNQLLRIPSVLVFGTLSLPLSCSDDKSGGGAGDAKCEAVCELQRDCPKDPDKAQCVKECEALAKACPDQALNLNNCTLARTRADFTCDEFDETALKEGVCEAETSAMFACFLGGADITLGDGDTVSPAGSGSTSGGTDTSPDTNSGSGGQTTGDTEEGNGISSDVGAVAPSGDKGIDCSGYCAITQTAECGETLAKCLEDCEQDEAALPAECVSMFERLVDCVGLDPGSSLTCSGTHPVISETVCAEQQVDFFECAIDGQVPAEDQAACAEACAGVDLTPPISCSNNQRADCETQCAVAVAVLGGDCADESVTAYSCAAAADASHWNCDDEGQATFEGTTCETEQAALLACFSG